MLSPVLATARTYPPPKGVRSSAQRGLDLRSQFHRGGTAVGIARARDLAGGKNVSEETIRRMNAFHSSYDSSGSSHMPDCAVWKGYAGSARSPLTQVRTTTASTTPTAKSLLHKTTHEMPTVNADVKGLIESPTSDTGKAPRDVRHLPLVPTDDAPASELLLTKFNSASQAKTGSAPSVSDQSSSRLAEEPMAMSTSTTRDLSSEVFSADRATVDSVSSETILSGANAPQCTCGLVDRLLNGGDAGKAWATKMTKQLDQEARTASVGVMCPEGDCEDTGWYGLENPANPDLLIGLIRDVNWSGEYEHLTADGWLPYQTDSDLLLISEDIAGDLAGALGEGCIGLLRRPTNPVAWVEGPVTVVAAMEVTATPVGFGAQQGLQVTDSGDGDGGSGGHPDLGQAAESSSSDGEDDESLPWLYYAIVDDLDTAAVLEVIRLTEGPKLQKWDSGGWIEDQALLSQLRGVDPPTLVELTGDQLSGVLAQMEPSGKSLEPQAPATVKPAGQPQARAAAALVADRVPTVSPNPKAAKLRRYWSTGEGGVAKIRWNTPGDFTRCVKQLRKYLGVRAKGYCANLHKMNTGVWPGSKLNVGRRGMAFFPAEELDLELAVSAGGWAYDARNKEAVDMLRDGIYTETTDRDPVIAALVAGAFPLKPPTEWFEPPKLSGPSPIEVSDQGQVSGHIATFDVAHIGMPGKVHAPRSRSGYAYFKTGVVRTASGADVQVGQITLAGGHAPLHADAGAAVEHYDNTASAVADVTIGEDRYGIWVAGAVRPESTPEQVRALRASAPSGDWRPINGSLELVAICQVNVPGFPVARARVASGAVCALVAAGAMPLARIRQSMLADASVADRLAALEETVYASVTDAVDPDIDGEVITETAVSTDGTPSTEDNPERLDKIVAAREYIRERRRQGLRDRVSAGRTPVAATP